jgi:hydrogenase-4 membrane subunit HyfE
MLLVLCFICLVMSIQAESNGLFILGLALFVLSIVFLGYSIEETKQTQRADQPTKQTKHERSNNRGEVSTEQKVHYCH